MNGIQDLTRKLAALPAAQQEQWIARFLHELAEEEKKAKPAVSPTEHWIGGRRPTEEEVGAAIERLRQFRRGKILGDDISLRDLIEEGRLC